MASPAPDLSEVITRLRAAGCVFAEDEAWLLTESAATPADLAHMVGQRAAGMPLEHVVGWAEFCGLRIAVAPGVFVPRRRTEFLVRTATDLARDALPAGLHGAAGLPMVVVDLCCGTGAVGAALAAALGCVELHAVDIDPAAVRCARENLAPGNIAPATASVYEGDLDGPLPAELRGRVALLVANVPYVPTGELRLLPAEARTYEARVALDGGADGLDVTRHVAAAAPRWLAAGGCLLTETSEQQVPDALAAMAASGLVPGVVRSADLEAVVVLGTWPGRGSPPPASEGLPEQE